MALIYFFKFLIKCLRDGLVKGCTAIKSQIVVDRCIKSVTSKMGLIMPVEKGFYIKQ